MKAIRTTGAMRSTETLALSTPGKPNTPRDTALAILALAFVVVSVVLVIPALIAALPALIAGRAAEGDVIALTLASADTLAPLVPSFRTAVSAFAVLMLTLFVEEGLRSTASDHAVRRSVAGFAFWGGIITTAMSFAAFIAAAANISRAGDAVITVGAGAVVLFFAAHLGTRGVLPLAQQIKAAAASLDSARRARNALSQRLVCSPPKARWTLVIYAALGWLVVPALCAGSAAVAPTALTPAVWYALGTCWAMVASLTGVFSFASLPDTPRVARAFAVSALALSGALLTGGSSLLAYLGYLDADASPLDRTTFTLFAVLSGAFVLGSLPWRRLPRFAPSALLWSIRVRQVQKEIESAETRVGELAATEAEHKLAAQEPAKPRHLTGWPSWK